MAARTWGRPRGVLLVSAGTGLGRNNENSEKFLMSWTPNAFPPGVPRKSCGRFLAALLLVAALAAPTLANEPLPEPAGRVILTISGAIDHTNADGTARFDRAMLERIGVTRVATSTSWTDGISAFEGVLARDLLRAVGATGDVVSAQALNDYAIEIPTSDFESYDVLFAFRMDGVDLTRRDKGPLWIVYPRDEHSELRNQKADAKWIWQLVKLDIK